MIKLWKGGVIMAQTLQMVFANQEGRNVTISVNEPNDGITGEEVRSVMDTIIDKSIFSTTGGDMVAVSAARLVSREVTELDIG
jgi:hypothetical protein